MSSVLSRRGTATFFPLVSEWDSRSALFVAITTTAALQGFCGKMGISCTFWTLGKRKSDFRALGEKSKPPRSAGAGERQRKPSKNDNDQSHNSNSFNSSLDCSYFKLYSGAKLDKGGQESDLWKAETSKTTNHSVENHRRN